uniref:Ras and Rab interactor 2a n=1 Tax=Kryptolebias marmoratus TaxID=37003 RepID=A0A3Q3B5L5_KRYMA
MPEKIAWINVPKDEEEKQSKPLSRLGSSLSAGLSSSPSKRFSISSLASISRQSLPLSLSSSPRRPKGSSLSSDYEDAQCHLALEEQTIETAIRRTQLSRQNALRSTIRDPHNPSNRTGGEVLEGPSQRLSDMSLSTDSSDSLDFSQPSAFLIPPLHDPSPPTVADFNIQLPLSLPPPHLRLSSINVDDDDDDDEEDEEEPIFGVSLESDHEPDQDQDQDLTMLPPCSSTRRRSSASAVVLQKALRGNLRKMSVVFNSLLTPEKRAVRKVRELSRDKGSYFGSLVQEYLSYMGEGAGTQELKENLSLYKARTPQEMGVADALTPDSVAIEKIRNKFQAMCKKYSPEKEVTILLRICKLIYTIMEDNSGRMYGADDFLPMLTYVLAQCDMPQLDNEILYMMELLDPSLLHGEGGYYLTSAYGAMSLIKNFKEDQAARVLSAETRDTLHQWHRRRTTQRSNYLRVALQELNSGCTAKTLQVRPYATVEDVCQLCARKFKVLDPESYGLFLQMEGSSQQLAPDTHPQKIKAELHSRPEAAPFLFVYRRVANSGTLSSATPNLNHLDTTPDPIDNLNHLSADLSEPSSEPGVGSDLGPPTQPPQQRLHL